MAEKKPASEETISSNIRPLSLHPFAVQLQNIVPVEIVAKRFPVEISNNTQINIQLNLTELHVDSHNLQAQVIMDAIVETSPEPRPFELSCRMVGVFIYASEYPEEDVRQFLHQGSVGVMLPFVRELIFSLCGRLQIPPIMLSLIQLAPPTDTKNDSDSLPQ